MTELCDCIYMTRNVLSHVQSQLLFCLLALRCVVATMRPTKDCLIPVLAVKLRKAKLQPAHQAAHEHDFNRMTNAYGCQWERKAFCPREKKCSDGFIAHGLPAAPPCLSFTKAIFPMWLENMFVAPSVPLFLTQFQGS